MNYAVKRSDEEYAICLANDNNEAQACENYESPPHGEDKVCFYEGNVFAYCYYEYLERKRNNRRAV